jgi:hypothetical protein
MIAKLTFRSAHAALICIGVGATIDDASAATSAEVAKKCATLTARAFPPRIAGNPAAGSAKGTGQSAFFNNCVAKGGEVDLPAESVPIPPERPH